MRTNCSRRSVLGVFLRGDKLGKIDFGQMLERFRRKDIKNEGIIAELKLLNC